MDVLEKRFFIIFTYMKWMEILNNNVITLNNTSNRKYLGYEFTKILNIELKKTVSCLVIRNTNWFKKPNSRKTSSPYWSGIYTCSICNGRIHMRIQDEIINKSDVKIGN